MTMNTIAEFVKQKRREAGLTQEEFAMRSGLGLRFVRELEQGKETVRMDKVNQALAMFGMKAVPGRVKSEPIERILNYKGYTGRVEYDDEQHIFAGSVINTRDEITFQGESVQEAEKAFRDSIDDYLTWCQEDDIEPDKPYPSVSSKI